MEFVMSISLCAVVNQPMLPWLLNREGGTLRGAVGLVNPPNGRRDL
jgi:hypothetical protein